LKEHAQAWFLASWQIVVERLPVLGEKITVKTWPYNFKGFYGYRNFTIEDAEGKICAKTMPVHAPSNSPRQFQDPLTGIYNNPADN